MHFVITGKINPGGKLSETFPVAYADLPVSQYYPGTEATSEYREGLYVGCRYAMCPSSRSNSANIVWR
mgnify:CR=1 FL=1